MGCCGDQIQRLQPSRQLHRCSSSGTGGTRVQTEEAGPDILTEDGKTSIGLSHTDGESTGV